MQTDPIDLNTPPQSFRLTAGLARFDERTILFGCCANDIKISGQDTAGRLGVFEYVGEVPGEPPLHLHLAQDEIYFVQEGEYLFQVGDDRSIVGPGGMIFLPRGVPHAFAQRSRTGRMLFAFTPAGQMEDYFRALARLDGPPPPPAEEQALFADHGMTLVGPPIDPDHAPAG